jgi:hypothetical protein
MDALQHIATVVLMVAAPGGYFVWRLHSLSQQRDRD